MKTARFRPAKVKPQEREQCSLIKLLFRFSSENRISPTLATVLHRRITLLPRDSGVHRSFLLELGNIKKITDYSSCMRFDWSVFEKGGKKFVGGIRTDKAGTTLNVGWGAFSLYSPILVWFCSGHWNYRVIIFKFISV